MSKHLFRSGVNKHRSVASFKHHAHRTPMLNMINPMRGGWRL